MDIRELARLVRACHDRNFGHTSDRERLRDLSSQVADLVHLDDPEKLELRVGEAAWSLIQLCNEKSIDLAQAVSLAAGRIDQTTPGKKVALLGTSANPITNAHLTLGLEILALTDVDEVWYLLVGQHPWGKKLMPAEHRLEMARRALARYPRLKACDFEIVHGPSVYPVSRETSHLLREHLLPAHPGYQFSWIMGSDVAQTFDQWQGASWIAGAMRVFIVHRLGYDFDKNASPLADPRHVYLRDNIVTSNISSSLVRERGRTYEHEKLVALVPDVVWDYLVEHRLLDPEVLRLPPSVHGMDGPRFSLISCVHEANFSLVGRFGCVHLVACLLRRRRGLSGGLRGARRERGERGRGLGLRGRRQGRQRGLGRRRSGRLEQRRRGPGRQQRGR